MRCVIKEKENETRLEDLFYGDVFAFDCSDTYFLLTSENEYFCLSTDTLLPTDEALTEFISGLAGHTISISEEPITIYHNAHLVLE